MTLENRKQKSEIRLSGLCPPVSVLRGYTLIELVVAVGLFAMVMTLASGAYLLMIGLNRQTQGISTGINDLSFALETMTRSIRTGTAYNCGALGGDCPNGGSSFSFKDTSGADVSYSRGQQGPNGSVGDLIKNGNTVLTDPSVDITALTFYVTGSGKASSGDFNQPHVTITVSGTVSYAAGKTKSFTIETGATMRGVDLATATLLPPPPAPVCTLSANPALMQAGGSSTLSWITTNAVSFTIDGDVVTPASSGTTIVSPITTTTYTGTVVGAGGSITCNAQVAVTTLVIGSCSSTHYNCVAGASIDNVDGASSWTWRCEGSGGGATVSCLETKPVFTGAGIQSWTVPDGVTTITVKAWGGGGGGGGGGQTKAGGAGGGGGFAQADIPVTPGESLALYVGGGGGKGSYVSGSTPTGTGGGGGGVTGILRGGTQLIIAAGGGGGGGGDNTGSGQKGTGGAGGAGGGASGIAGSNIPSSPNPGTGGGAGTPGAGGVAGTAAGIQGASGAALLGGHGGNTSGPPVGLQGTAGTGGTNGGGPGGQADATNNGRAGAGGGGAGYFGAGGGGAAVGPDTGAGGGGGGSSHTTGTNVSNTAGDGQTAGNSSDAGYINNAGKGGNAGAAGTGSGTDGRTGLLLITY